MTSYRSKVIYRTHTQVKGHITDSCSSSPGQLVFDGEVGSWGGVEGGGHTEVRRAQEAGVTGHQVRRGHVTARRVVTRQGKVHCQPE